eukprot:COSAG02_NODE_52570_length_307_cov_0.634615_1_plen_37_part_01
MREGEGKGESRGGALCAMGGENDISLANDDEDVMTLL